MTDDHRLKILNDADGFNAQNGIKLTEWENGFGALRVDLEMHHVNPMQLIHGGLYISMLDVALAMTLPTSTKPTDAGHFIADNTISLCSNLR